MKALWRMLAESWPMARPRARLRAEIGEKAVDAIECAGLARTAALQPGDRYPCRCQARRACAMRLVDEDGLVAVCELGPAECLDERIDDDDSVRLHIEPASLAPILQRALRLPVTPSAPVRGVLPLGDRRVGQVEVRFVLAPRPGPWVAGGWLARSVDEDPDRVLVVLAFDRASIPAGAARRVHGTRVEWVALAESLSLEGPTIDLGAFWQSIATGVDLAAELWPRYAFTADPEHGRFTYAGRALPVDRELQEAKLLIELLRGRGDWVPRAYLLATLWPSAFEGKNRPTPDQLDRRLRDAKSKLSAAFNSLPPIEGVLVDPVENLRTRSDAEGGYRIAVAPERVLWLSEPG